MAIHSAILPGLISPASGSFAYAVSFTQLLATPILYDIVQFTLPDSYAPSISSRRSPQLTNGHVPPTQSAPQQRSPQESSGQQDARSNAKQTASQQQLPWEQGMPLGDIFVGVMQKAWSLQKDRARTSISPMYVLTIPSGRARPSCSLIHHHPI